MKKLLFFSTICAVLFIGSSVICAKNTTPEYPYPAIVGYWGCQAASDECQAGNVTMSAAADNGYNVIVLSFADVAGNGTNPPPAGSYNFFDGGWSATTPDVLGAITFPASTNAYKKAQSDYIIKTIGNEIVELNNKGVVILLSFGGAGAKLPTPLPEPIDVYNAFVSFNNFLNEKAGTSGKQLVHGLDWDLENSVCFQKDIEWMAKVSFKFKEENLIITCAPQSTNFNPTIGTWTSGNWNCYVPLVAAMDGNGTPIDAVMVQWYEPGGSHPANNANAITDFINQYYSPDWKVSFPTETLPGYKSTWPGIGNWLKTNKQKLLAGDGTGTWNGATNYTPSYLVEALQETGLGGFGVWDTEIDSGCIKAFSVPGQHWYVGNGLSEGLNKVNWTSNIQETDRKDSGFSLEWDKATFNKDIIHYFITGAGLTNKDIGTNNSYEFKNIESDKEYPITIEAKDITNTKITSATANYTADTYKNQLGWKTIPNATKITKVSATISWEAKIDSNSEGIIYTVKNGATEVYSGPGTSENLTDLTEGTSYTVTVTAQCDGSRDLIKTVNFRTLGGYPEWNSKTAYNGGAKVDYKDIGYTAKWWTQGDEPDKGGPWGLIK
jgi:chitodextrinase